MTTRTKQRPHDQPHLVRDTPEAASALAWRRVQSFARWWYLLDFDLKRLLVSCYLQGVEDAATAVARNPSVLTSEPIDYQI